MQEKHILKCSCAKLASLGSMVNQVDMASDLSWNSKLMFLMNICIQNCMETSSNSN